MQVINRPKQIGQLNTRAGFPLYQSVLQKPDFGQELMGKPIVFDMDMSAGDFLALLYLLKLPVELINLKVLYCLCRLCQAWCYTCINTHE